MSMTAELEAIIIANIKAVTKIRGAGMAFEKFLKEYARYLAQAEIDKDPLTSAKFQWEKKALYDGYLYMLTEERADRIIAEGIKSSAKQDLTNVMPGLKIYLETLIKVCKFIIERTANKNFEASYKMVKFSNKRITILNNIIYLAELIETELELAAQISPGGEEINQEYLDKVNGEAHHAIELEAQAESSTSERSLHVDIQNKLITLCLDAQHEIITFADSAFINDRAYFKEHYTNHVRREMYKQSKKEDETVEDDEL